MFKIESDTIDRYLGYHYYVPVVMLKGKHKKPYVAVDQEGSNVRVAWIKIETHEVEYYSHTPRAVKKDEAKFKDWIKKNHQSCVKMWNQLNPQYPLKL
jgi:hypothetical protein